MTQTMLKAMAFSKSSLTCAAKPLARNVSPNTRFMAENGGFCITAGVVGRQKLVSAQVVEVPQGAPCAVVAAIAHHLCVMTNSVGLERDYRTGAKLGGSPDVVARPHAEEKDSGPSGLSLIH